MNRFLIKSKISLRSTVHLWIFIMSITNSLSTQTVNNNINFYIKNLTKFQVPFQQPIEKFQSHMICKMDINKIVIQHKIHHNYNHLIE